MLSKEILDIKDFWEKKYPNVDITLLDKSSDGRYHGRIIFSDSSVNLNAATLGELISSGESFLRNTR